VPFDAVEISRVGAYRDTPLGSPRGGMPEQLITVNGIPLAV